MPLHTRLKLAGALGVLTGRLSHLWMTVCVCGWSGRGVTGEDVSSWIWLLGFVVHPWTQESPTRGDSLEPSLFRDNLGLTPGCTGPAVARCECAGTCPRWREAVGRIKEFIFLWRRSRSSGAEPGVTLSRLHLPAPEPVPRLPGFSPGA